MQCTNINVLINWDYVCIQFGVTLAKTIDTKNYKKQKYIVN